MVIDKRETDSHLSAAKSQINVLNDRIGDREATITKKDEEIKSLQDNQAKHEAELKRRDERIRVLEKACEQKNKKLRWWDDWYQKEKTAEQEKRHHLANGTYLRSAAVQTIETGIMSHGSSTKSAGRGKGKGKGK